MPQHLETKRFFLRLAEDSDESVLAAWQATADYLKFVYSGKRQRYHLRFMICRRRDGRPVGVAYTFSYNQHDGYLFFSVFLEEGYRKVGYGAEACALAICHIFDSVPLYKMYCDVLASNPQALSMNKAGGLEQEGFLKGHVLYDDQRHDVIRFAVHQENLTYLRTLLTKFQNRKTG